ncbi:hypothetical protein [Paraburkholderia kirstenboschensis]|uniref:hypothetical protein n=1 Tax=Paraburkholderia kirstenboschensis TaxID=1245436 RepID=UPI00191B2D61|nr:hypothetical protein [Paraburkholderia kirstenboschensis]
MSIPSRSLLVVGFTTLIYLGFFVSNIILAGKTLHAAIPPVPVPSLKSSAVTAACTARSM